MARCAERLAACCDEVVVVAPEDAALPIREDERVADAIPQAGPLS